MSKGMNWQRQNRENRASQHGKARWDEATWGERWLAKVEADKADKKSKTHQQKLKGRKCKQDL